MKNSTLLLTFLFIILMSCSQTKNSISLNRDAITTIQTIFNDYVKHQESTDSKSNKELMTKSFKSIDIVTAPNELDLLINVWMYYDPTDYTSQPLLYTILENNKPQSIEAVKLRMKTKKEWENETSAPYSELKDLLQQLSYDNEKTLNLMQGKWIHDLDSLATIKVEKNQFTFMYEGKETESNDSYSISITNKLSHYQTPNENSEFLFLTTKSDTLAYEILGISKESLSLMYLPSGKIHYYNRR